MSPNDSRTSSIDLSPLVDAKSNNLANLEEYISKSKDILNSLDKILAKYHWKIHDYTFLLLP